MIVLSEYADDEVKRVLGAVCLSFFSASNRWFPFMDFSVEANVLSECINGMNFIQLIAKYPLYQPLLSQINKVANLCHHGIQKHDSVTDNGVA
jgi:hypothetical protein